MSEQRANLGRVQQNISWAVEKWCRERVLSGQRMFRGEELEAGVAAMVRCTPGSPLRLFREALRHGLIEGRLVSRSDSLYELGPSSDSQKPPAGANPPSRRSGALPSWECPCGCAERLREYGITRCFGGAA